MTTSLFIKLFPIAFVTFIVIDMIWLVVIARSFYKAQIGHLLAPTIQWGPAILFYLLFVAGLIVFVIGPAFTHHSVGTLIAYAAFFGLVTYATYDLTNLATTKDWPLLVTVVDLLWGSTLATLVSLSTYIIGSRLL